MSYWVLKGYDDQTEWEECCIPGKTGWWYTTKKPPKHWMAGDRLFFWRASPYLFVTCLGVSEGLVKEDDGLTRVKVRYQSTHCSHHVPMEELKAMFESNLPSFLKSGPQGTIYPLDDERAEALYRALVARNPQWSGVWPGLDDGLILNVIELAPEVPIVELATEEGRRQWSVHLRRERRATTVASKKSTVVRAGKKLKCEACGFDFAKVYGPMGKGFCEVHHRRPLDDAGSGVVTALKDLAVVCSNCHRMLHRKRPVMTVEKLAKFLKARNQKVAKSSRGR